MSRLFLSCGLCERKQADGLISRGFWGHLELGNGTALRACPSCKEAHTDWEVRLRATLATAAPPAPPADRSPFGFGGATAR